MLENAEPKEQEKIDFVEIIHDNQCPAIICKGLQRKIAFADQYTPL